MTRVSTSQPLIHPAAVIDSEAQVAPDARIGPFVVIEADVVVGSGSEVLTGSVIHAGSRIGARCRVGPYAVVGGEPMDWRFEGERSFVILEDEVTVREFVTVHRATGEGSETRVGEGTLLMSYAHLGHNVRVGRGCTLTNGVQLGGYCEIGEYAVLGSAVLLHQFCRVGSHAMFGAGSAGNRDVLPFTMARGNPAKHYRLNRVGLERRGITGERYQALEQAARAFRQRDFAGLEALSRDNEDVRSMLEFRKTSTRGLARFA